LKAEPRTQTPKCTTNDDDIEYELRSTLPVCNKIWKKLHRI